MNSNDEVIHIVKGDINKDNFSPNNYANQHDENDSIFKTNSQLQDPVINFNTEVNESEQNHTKSFFINPEEEQSIRPGSSVEAVNLNSWPASSTDTSPEQLQKDKLGRFAKINIS